MTMPRTTRATAKAQEAEQPVMSTDTRNGVTNSNNPDIVVDSDQPEPKKAKGKKKGKSKKNKKNKLQDGDEAGLAESEEPLVEANQEEKTGVEEPEPVVSADRDHQSKSDSDPCKVASTSSRPLLGCHQLLIATFRQRYH